MKDTTAPPSDSRAAGAAFEAGVAAFQAGDLVVAAEHFERARALDPRAAAYHFNAAVAQWKLGKTGAARECCETALSLDPGLHHAHGFLADLSLPGPRYLEVISWFHSELRPRTYLEIGVETGESIVLARPETRAIGVEPEPRIDRRLLPGTKIVASTSDEYFATRDVRAELGGLPVDLAFIDGMHRFEFALRDFIHIEKYCTPQSTVLIHDCYPLSRLTAERERRTAFWTGDIWRLILLLRKHRADLSVGVIATAPTGLGIARCLDPESRVLEDNYEAIVEEFLAVDYSVLETDKRGMLALYPNDAEKIREFLRRSGL